MKRLRTLLGIGLGLAVVAGAGYYISQNSASAPSRQGQGRFGAGLPTPVGLTTAAKGDIPIVVRALGTVTALNTVNVKTQITGQLIKVEFKEGQMVKQGDLLAVVDPRPYDVACSRRSASSRRTRRCSRTPSSTSSATRTWSPRTRLPASSTTPRPRWSASTRRPW